MSHGPSKAEPWGPEDAGWWLAVCQPAGQPIGASGCHRALLPADPVRSMSRQYEAHAYRSLQGDSSHEGRAVEHRGLQVDRPDLYVRLGVDPGLQVKRERPRVGVQPGIAALAHALGPLQVTLVVLTPQPPGLHIPLELHGQHCGGAVDVVHPIPADHGPW